MVPPSPTPARFSREERVGLVVAVAAHVALFAWLALEPLGKPVLAPPERMTVSFADEAAVESVSPEPFAEAAPEIGPELGEPPPLYEPIPPDEPAADAAEPPPVPPVAKPSARSVAQPSAKPVAKPKPKPTPRPVAKPTVRPRPAASASPAPRPSPAAKPKSAAKAAAKVTPKAAAKPAAKAPAKPSAKPAAQAGDARDRRRPDAPSGASRIGSDFLKGVPGAPAAGAAQNPPAAKAGPQVAASLSQSIARQLKPRWTAPQGVEADRLVTVLAWDLNRDGSLAGRPRVVSQAGVTDANRAQQARHAEQAIRAVQLAAPFDLPPQYYDSWKRVASFRFDRKLSQ